MNNNETFEELLISTWNDADYLIRGIMRDLSHAKDYLLERSNVSEDIEQGCRMMNAFINTYFVSFYSKWNKDFNADDFDDASLNLFIDLHKWADEKYGKMTREVEE